MNPAILSSSRWITCPVHREDRMPVFRRRFSAKPGTRAQLDITALGVYEAELNGTRVGDFVMAPGYTHYPRRVQVQGYDISHLLKEENQLIVRLGRGWYGSKLMVSPHDGRVPLALRAVLQLADPDGETCLDGTDGTWDYAWGETTLSGLYEGEHVNCSLKPENWEKALVADHDGIQLVPQEGPAVREQDRLKPVSLLTSPRGETILDFGQNLTGYVACSVTGRAGDEVLLHHAEVLDAQGNFYTENLREARQEYRAILKDGLNSLKPRFTFYGFRYLRLSKWPGPVDPAAFTAIAVHSDMERSGHFVSGNPLVNQLYHNALWGQKGNFVDVPTDCPQRDERLGWTGDAQAFIRTACYNYNALGFYKKWLADLALCQFPGGGVPHFVPSQMTEEERLSKGDTAGHSSSGWGDAACICPWQLYLHYGDKQVLADQFDAMKAWVDCIRRTGETETLWNTGHHFGDWLAQDGATVAGGGADGATDKFLIATAMYAQSTDLLVRAGRVLGRDMAEYEDLHRRIRADFQRVYMPGGRFPQPTQTACVLALAFDLCGEKEEVANTLVNLVEAAGTKLQTGFLGTPYLLHMLSDHGYSRLAYDLLLQEEAPSWMHSVLHGATTIWERWDGIRADGSMNNPGMNSFNHYAFGAVADWMYMVVAGIQPVEAAPGFEEVVIAPHPDERLGFARAALATRFGTIKSSWAYTPGGLRYEITIPKGVQATIRLPHLEGSYGPGAWHF